MENSQPYNKKYSNHLYETYEENFMNLGFLSIVKLFNNLHYPPGLTLLHNESRITFTFQMKFIFLCLIYDSKFLQV